MIEHYDVILTAVVAVCNLIIAILATRKMRKAEGAVQLMVNAIKKGDETGIIKDLIKMLSKGTTADPIIKKAVAKTKPDLR